MNPDTKGQLLTIWIIWLALLSGVFIMRSVAGNMAAATPAGESPAWMVPLAGVAAATFIRWVQLPRARGFQRLLPLFIIGIALSEGACVIGLFALRSHLQPLFSLGVVSMLQFAPVYARRQIEEE